jgi:hypothetical protein
MVGAATTVRVRLCGSEATRRLSVALTANVAVAAEADSVPEITPAVLRVKPAGKVPLLTAHV